MTNKSSDDSQDKIQFKALTPMYADKIIKKKHTKTKDFKDSSTFQFKILKDVINEISNVEELDKLTENLKMLDVKSVTPPDIKNAYHEAKRAGHRIVQNFKAVRQLF